MHFILNIVRINNKNDIKGGEMENFRPPVMDEFSKQQIKKKYIIFCVVIFSIVILIFGSYFSFKKIKIYLNYLSVEKKYQLLSNYYKALLNKDANIIAQIAPEFSLTNTYNFLTVSGSYSLYIYPGIQTNENNLLFTLIDNSVNPSISYIKEVTYKKETNSREIIQSIKEIGIGHQIN